MPAGSSSSATGPGRVLHWSSNIDGNDHVCDEDRAKVREYHQRNGLTSPADDADTVGCA